MKWLAIFQILPLCAMSGHIMNVDDSIIFSMNWEAPADEISKEFEDQHESLRMLSAKNEPYTCYVPRKLRVKGKQEKLDPYTGPTPHELLRPLFLSKTCRFKLDYYWTYQLCHGRSLRQYHEDTMTSKVSIVEFYLGTYDEKMLERDREAYEEKLKNAPGEAIPTMKINGVDHPYLAINMSLGTLCDINQRPRSTIVYYVCHEDGDNDIFTLEESSTCTYKIIVKTPYLCQHPLYKVDVAPENYISCRPDAEATPESKVEAVDEESSNPLADSLTGYEPEDLKQMAADNQDFKDDSRMDAGEVIYSVGDIKDVLEAVERSLKVVFLPDNDDSPLTAPAHDSKHIEQFLKGEFCLTGGAGWWRYEFCYGKRVTQFHMEKGQRTQEILLGQWDESKHRRWIRSRKSRKVSPNPEFVRHFYDSGDVCEVTSEPRVVEVKLTCKVIKKHPDAVSIFLQEPKPCQYKLTVESAIICDLLKTVDEDGLPEQVSPIDAYPGNKLNER